MTIFERLFGVGSSTADEGQPNIAFGRYTDIYKVKLQYDAWDLAVELFDEGKHMDAYRAFFKYLRDEKEDNVHLKDLGTALEFEIFQGSKRIRGVANAAKVRAEAKIAKADTTNVGFMRRLVEHNFNLKYSRFALDPDNCIVIIFDTHIVDGSPLKLYHALKELAISADKLDDLLIDEFKMLHPVDDLLQLPIDPKEKQVKYEYIQSEIKKAFLLCDANNPDTNQYPGGYAYMFLALSYKLDYLIKPEGFMMETMEKIHREYFAAKEKNTQVKLLSLRKEFQKLLDRPQTEFFKEFYRTKSTFGITSPVNHDRVASLIQGELLNMDWYRDNGHTELALAIPGYIIGFCNFNYALPKPAKELFLLYYKIMESEYFEALGFNLAYKDANGALSKKTIVKAIKEIVEINRKSYPKMAPDTSLLQFELPVLFAKSYLEMVATLNLVKEDG